jgi:glycosyltransferase involved in cell wall biosynthesis
MKIAFANARFRTGVPEGADAHVRQVVANAHAIGHEVWMWRPGVHPDAHALPEHRLARLRVLRTMDVLYTRVQHEATNPLTWTLGPRRALLGNPLVVWEFNTVPEYGKYRGMSSAQIQEQIDRFRHFGRGCDLAICVSQHLADYVQEKLAIRNVLAVPNGSDPDLYRPDLEPFARVRKGADVFNVIWMGSAFTAWHNFALLAEAAQIIHGNGNPHNIQFHIMGPGMDRMRDMPPNVHYQGSEQYELLPRWLAGMDAGLCLYRPGPADYSSPLKVFDYMSSALAVVATDQPQTRQICAELDQNDLLVPSDDPKRLADVLVALSRDRQRTRGLGQAARELLIRKYTWRRAIVTIFDAVERMLQQRRGLGNTEKPAGVPGRAPNSIETTGT